MSSALYTLEQFRQNPAIFHHDVGTVYVGVDVGQQDSPRQRVREFCEVLLMTDSGCVVQGNYMWPDEWSLGSRATDPTGCGIYVVPWGELSGPYTERQVEQTLACMDADQRMLSYAR